MIRNRMPRRKLNIYLICISLGLTALWAQPPVPPKAVADSTALRPALPDTLLNSYLADSDFRAMFDESVKTDFLSDLWDWLWYNILRFIFTPALKPFWMTIFYVIVAGIFLYFISRFFKVNIRSLFYRTATVPRARGTVVSSDDLSTDSFHKIQQAIERQDFREALRLLFVSTLQMLNKQKKILLTRDKTNLDYLIELREPDLKDRFRRLALIFDYVWYGDFNVDSDRFAILRPYFDDFRQKLGGRL